MKIDAGKVVDDYLTENGWKVNANSNSGYSFSGLVNHAAGSVIANYLLDKIYGKKLKEAHEKGYLHIHDLTHGLVGYCAGWSLKNLLIMGFGNVSGQMESKPAKHLDTAILHIINFLRCAYNEFAGAQAFSSFDTYLAPFVAADKLSYKRVKQEMQRLVFSLNVASRWGFEMPFTNLTFDVKPPADLKDEAVIIGGKPQKSVYGEFGKEMEMINKTFLEVMLEGDDLGRIFTFPIPTYNLTRDFDWESAVARLLFKVTARFGIPYFQNYIASGLDPNSIRAMCCRLNLNMNELMNQPGSLWGKGDSTGSVGVVTMNINRLAYLSAEGKKIKNEKSKIPACDGAGPACDGAGKNDNSKLKINKFFKLLGRYMDLGFEALEIKRKLVTENLGKGLMPYTKAYLGTFRNYFSTIGICGMNEACLNLLGVDIADRASADRARPSVGPGPRSGQARAKTRSSNSGLVFTKKTLEFMRQKLVEFQKKSGHLYNLEATPAESTAYRFALLDKKYCPGIKLAGTKDVPYLTNSTHLPVHYTDDVWEALLHQNEIQPLYSGGTVFHTFLGEEIDDWRACRLLVRKIAEKTKLPYFTMTPTFSICIKHGRLKGREDKCPKCGELTEVYSRIVGYFRPVSRWNYGKKQEFEERKTYEIQNEK